MEGTVATVLKFAERKRAGWIYLGEGVLGKDRADGKRSVSMRYSWRGKRLTEKVGAAKPGTHAYEKLIVRAQ